jgi:hypothetical protein
MPRDHPLACSALFVAPKKTTKMKDNAFKRHVMMGHWAPITLHKLPTDNVASLDDLENGDSVEMARPQRISRPNNSKTTLVAIKRACGERVVVQAQARPVSLERERALGHGSLTSLDTRGFMIVRDNAARRLYISLPRLSRPIQNAAR